MYIFAGLGNAGRNYSTTRHNVGFMLVDALSQHFGGVSTQGNKFADIVDCDIAGTKIKLVKSKSFMNLSGQNIGQVVRFYKVPIENIIICHDDLDLSLGRTKVKIGGGTGGHNGLKSLDQHISKDYMRIRIGIGRHEYMDASDYVLQKFTSSEKEVIDELLYDICNNFSLLFDKNMEEFIRCISNN